MIIIGGEQHIQPTDFPIIAYNGGKYLLVSDGDRFRRLAIEELRPSNLYDISKIWGQDGHYITFWAGGNTTIYSPGSLSIKSITGPMNLNCDGYQLRFYAPLHFFYEGHVKTWPADSGKKMYATDFIVHPSLARDKINIAPFDGRQALAKIRPRTFQRKGENHTGFLIDDIQKIQLPGFVTLDEEGKVDGYSHDALLSLAFERIQALEARIKQLEAKK